MIFQPLNGKFYQWSKLGAGNIDPPGLAVSLQVGGFLLVFHSASMLSQAQVFNGRVAMAGSSGNRREPIRAEAQSRGALHLICFFWRGLAPVKMCPSHHSKGSSPHIFLGGAPIFKLAFPGALPFPWPLEVWVVWDFEPFLLESPKPQTAKPSQKWGEI